MATDPTPTPDQEQPANTALTFDPDAYRHLLPEGEMTREEQTRLLEAVWQVVVSFVDLGFGIHPVQQAMGVGKTSGGLAGDSLGLVSCGEIFNRLASNEAGPAGRRAAKKRDS